MDYARRLERIESVKAKERKSIGGQGGLEYVQNFAYLDQGTTRDIVAEKIGIGSGETYRKEKFIADNADPELLKKWDEGDISTHKAYIELKQQLAEKDKLLQQAKCLRGCIMEIQQNENQLATLSDERITAEILIYKDQVGYGMIELGKRLIEMKKRRVHGTWLNYLASEVKIPTKLAEELMILGREFGDKLKNNSYSTLWGNMN